EQNLHSRRMSVAKCLQVSKRNLKLRVEQGAININGQKADGRSHCMDSSIAHAADSQANFANASDIFCSGNGITVLFFRVVVGLSAGSNRHHPLHPPPS